MKKSGLYLFFIGLCLHACTLDEAFSDATDKSLPPVARMNDFTESKMKTIYLWAEEVKDRQPDLNEYPVNFFQSLVYAVKDPWSYIDGHYAESSADVRGFDNGFGYCLQLYYNSAFAYAWVCYVYPHTPAAEAGLKRGDIIYKINGEPVNIFNYSQLYASSLLQIELANLQQTNNGFTLVPQPTSYTLLPRHTEVNPVIVKKILRKNNHKVGYLHYTEFMDNGKNNLSDLTEVIRYFKKNHIDELILDLRYNRGGYLSAARHLCSLLAPSSAVSNEDLLITKQWNKEYHKKMVRKNLVAEHFDKETQADNLDLRRLYVITGELTASASELLISGLKPYLDEVILVGSQTQGKYVGAYTYQPDDPEITNWAIHPIVFSYRNARGESVEGGLMPDYLLTENEYNNLPLGNPEEKLLKTTLAILSGETISPTRHFTTNFRKTFTSYDRKHSLLIGVESRY